MQTTTSASIMMSTTTSTTTRRRVSSFDGYDSILQQVRSRVKQVLLTKKISSLRRVSEDGKEEGHDDDEGECDDEDEDDEDEDSLDWEGSDAEEPLNSERVSPLPFRNLDDIDLILQQQQQQQQHGAVDDHHLPSAGKTVPVLKSETPLSSSSSSVTVAETTRREEVEVVVTLDDHESDFNKELHKAGMLVDMQERYLRGKSERRMEIVAEALENLALMVGAAPVPMVRDGEDEAAAAVELKTVDEMEREGGSAAGDGGAPKSVYQISRGSRGFESYIPTMAPMFGGGNLSLDNIIDE